MNEQKRFFDVWFVGPNKIYKQVPFHVIVEWVQQARVAADDMVKPTGTVDWFYVANDALFSPYLPQPDPQKVGDAAEALEPIEMDFNWKRRAEDDDDDVDMIPLIDISLVLLIFFMMSASVASVSHIAVPSVENASTLDADPSVLRVDVDLVENIPIYGLGKGTAAPDKENADISDVKALMLRLEDVAGRREQRPAVRIAAHGDLPYSIVEKVMQALDAERLKGVISEYTIEVNEKPK